MSSLGDPTGWTDRERELYAEGWNDCLKMQPGENGRLRAEFEDACKVFDHYDLPEHALHYRRRLSNKQQPDKP